MTEWNTTHIKSWLARIRAGDEAARNELLAGCQQRLTRLVRKMLRTRFPDVGRWEDTNDVLQNVNVRLDRALRDAPVNDAEHFLRLASENIRRVLIDLARRIRGPNGTPVHHESPRTDENGQPVWREPTTTDTLAWWEQFHEAVDRLPEGEREVFSHIFYGELTQIEVAQLLGVSESTVKRRWKEAQLQLFEKLGDNMPDDFGENS